jgi:apolipoprotein N-acyltransferase
MRTKTVARLPWLMFAASGGMLAASFPPLDWTWLAWVALVPGIWAATRLATMRRVVVGGLLCGAVFWWCSIFWLTRVTVAGWFGLSLYCGLYFIPFFAGINWWHRRFGFARSRYNVLLMLLGVVLWTGFEYSRSRLFTGFGWNTLGTCLYKEIPVLQAARLGGVFLLSGLIIWMNLGIAVSLLRYAACRGRPVLRWHPEFMLAILAWALAFAFGTRLLLRESAGEESVRIALIQPNIPQDQKWFYGEVTPEAYYAYCSNIYTRLYSLTREVMLQPDVDLAVWPETAVPDDILTSEASYNLVYALVTNGVPLLMGSMDTEYLDNGGYRFFNSSFLFATNGIAVTRYDKQHLVMFGEYVPLADEIPFVSAMTPIQESFSAGTEATLFYVGDSGVAFAVLICFEDTVGPLARKAVRRGARLLINQTNDAWFDPLSGSKQHLTHSVLRAVENGVPVARAANTGVSAVIDRFGRVRDAVRAENRTTMVAGTVIADVPVPTQDMSLTPYTRGNDRIWQAFAIAGWCFAAGLFFVGRR